MEMLDADPLRCTPSTLELKRLDKSSYTYELGRRRSGCRDSTAFPAAEVWGAAKIEVIRRVIPCIYALYGVQVEQFAGESLEDLGREAGELSEEWRGRKLAEKHSPLHSVGEVGTRPRAACLVKLGRRGSEGERCSYEGLS